MPAKVDPKPSGYPTLTPYLIVRDGDRAIEFYKNVFGATERMRMPAPGGRVGHAELAIGDSLIMLADEAPEHNAFAPTPERRGSVSLHLYVSDSDAVVQTAVSSGAKLVQPVETKFYGDRMGTITDPFGHVWHVSTHVEDVSAEEMDRRAKAQAAGTG